MHSLLTCSHAPASQTPCSNPRRNPTPLSLSRASATSIPAKLRKDLFFHQTNPRLWLKRITEQGWAPSSHNSSLCGGPFPVSLTWFAGNGLDGQSQLGVRGDRQWLVTWGKGWNHDVRHVNLLKAKKPTVSHWGPKALPRCRSAQDRR